MIGEFQKPYLFRKSSPARLWLHYYCHGRDSLAVIESLSWTVPSLRDAGSFFGALQDLRPFGKLRAGFGLTYAAPSGLESYNSILRLRPGFSLHGSLTDQVYCRFANSALACLRMGMSGSASFHRVRKSW